MDVMVRIAAVVPLDDAGVSAYVGCHLQKSVEVDSLARVPGYLSRDGLVKPIVPHPELWKAVGWDPEILELPPVQLLEALTAGRDLEGNRLQPARGKFRAPKEALITLPSELSEALKHLPPEVGLDILHKSAEAYLEDLENQAVRVQVKRKRDFSEARTLSLIYLHQENRAGESHWHAHVLTFLPALDPKNRWRTLENARQVARLSAPRGGRAKITQAMVEAARRNGIQVNIRRGLAREHPLEAPGATVTMPTGQCFLAGRVFRQRRAEILASQELRRELGVSPLTRIEVERLRKSTGKMAKELPQVRRMDLFLKKLEVLELVDKDGRIPPAPALADGLARVMERMSMAEVRLEASGRLPGPYTTAAKLVGDQQAHLARKIGADPLPSRANARIRWTREYERTMLLALDALQGLETAGLDKSTRNSLSKLKAAGLLKMEKHNGRALYTPTAAGLARMEQLRIQRGDMGHSLHPGLHPDLGTASDSSNSPAKGLPTPSLAAIPTSANLIRKPGDRGGTSEVHARTEPKNSSPLRGDEQPPARERGTPSPRPYPHPRMETLRPKHSARHGSFEFPFRGGRTSPRGSFGSPRPTQSRPVDGDSPSHRFAGFLPTERTVFEPRPGYMEGRWFPRETRFLLHASSAATPTPSRDLCGGSRAIPDMAFRGQPFGLPGSFLGAGRGMPGAVSRSLQGTEGRGAIVPADSDAALSLSLDLWSRNNHALTSAARWLQELERQKRVQQNLELEEKRKQELKAETARRSNQNHDLEGIVVKVPPGNPKAKKRGIRNFEEGQIHTSAKTAMKAKTSSPTREFNLELAPQTKPIRTHEEIHSEHPGTQENRQHPDHTIATRRSLREQRANRAAASQGKSGEEWRQTPQIISKSLRAVEGLGEPIARTAQCPAPGPGSGPSLGFELGIGDRRGVDSGAGYREGNRRSPTPANNPARAMGRDARGPEAGRSGRTPDSETGQSFCLGGEPGGGSLQNPTSGSRDEPESLILRMAREIREYEASDPQDLRELVEMRAEEIHEIFPEIALDSLQPVQATLELPWGQVYHVQPIQVAPEPIQAAIFELDDIFRQAAGKAHGLHYSQSNKSLVVAETWFRAGYGLEQLQLELEDLNRPWGERLGRLIRSSWQKLLDQAVDLAGRARRTQDYRAEQAWRDEIQNKLPKSPFDRDSPSYAPEKSTEKPKHDKRGGIEF